MKFLVIEHDQETAASMARFLREYGHVVDVAGTGEGGVLLAVAEGHQVLVVDRMLPGLDGLGLVRALREAGPNAPVLFLTALGGVDGRVQGPEADFGDHLIAPFGLPELLARLQAFAGSEPSGNMPTRLSIADLEIDLLKQTVTRAGERVELQLRQFKLLEYLLRHADQVVTRMMLLEGVWGFRFDPKTNIVETHVSRLRSKLSRGGRHPELIHTIRGSGYLLRAPDV